MSIATPDRISSTDLPVRDDLAAAHAEIARRWARPGTWWTADQRSEIIQQVRAARDHRTNSFDVLPPWVQPSDIDGLIDSESPLPAPAIDAVWRITNHPGTLTHDWYTSIIERGVDPLAYVELVGLVAQANCVDRFADALELPRADLAAPTAGPPSREGTTAQVLHHWVPTLELKFPNVIKALSAVPAENEALFILSDAQYLPIEQVLSELVSDQNSLTRPQIEVVAARTSKLNECFY